MKRITLFALLCLIIFSTAVAQTPIIQPNNTPGKIPLPTPKIVLPKPDLQFVSANVVSVEELTASHMFRIKLSITYKNAGRGDAARGFYLDLQNFFGTTGGGTNHVQVGSNCNLHALAAGASRTEEWWFLKDVTALGRGPRQFMVRIDCTNLIAESDETNNNSPVFDIDIH